MDVKDLMFLKVLPCMLFSMYHVSFAYGRLFWPAFNIPAVAHKWLDIEQQTRSGVSGVGVLLTEIFTVN